MVIASRFDICSLWSVALTVCILHQGRSSTDARIVPNLIYAIESYERYVIQVGRDRWLTRI